MFGIVTGRGKASTEAALRRYPLPPADIIICSVGTEIYYTPHWLKDTGWESYINHQWYRTALWQQLKNHPLLCLQEACAQTRFKLSYYVDDNFDQESMPRLHAFLERCNLHCNMYLTENKYLDIVPVRAGKGNAVQYISRKWNIAPRNIITAGNSGNDIDMLSGPHLSIVVSNHSREMAVLKGDPSVYFSKAPLSAGIWEGIQHYTGYDDKY